MPSWTKELKPGDRVVIDGRYGLISAVVERLTKTQIVIGSNRFRKTTGLAVGDYLYGRPSLEPWTQELQDRIDTQKLKNYFARADWSHVGLDQLKRIYAIYTEAEQL